MSTAEKIDIAALRKFDGTLFARNNTRNAITCNEGKTLEFALGPAGHPDAVKVLPKECLDVPGWQRLMFDGRVTVSPDLADEAIEGARAQSEAEAVRRAGINETLEEPAQNKDRVEKECLISGKRVFQTLREINDMVPPLAPEYAHLAYQFVPEQSVDAKGDTVVRFNRVSIG